MVMSGTRGGSNSPAGRGGGRRVWGGPCNSGRSRAESVPLLLLGPRPPHSASSRGRQVSPSLQCHRSLDLGPSLTQYNLPLVRFHQERGFPHEVPCPVPGGSDPSLCFWAAQLSPRHSMCTHHELAAAPRLHPPAFEVAGRERVSLLTTQAERGLSLSAPTMLVPGWSLWPGDVTPLCQAGQLWPRLEGRLVSQEKIRNHYRRCWITKQFLSIKDDSK